METRMVVNKETGLQEQRDMSGKPQNAVIRLVAKVISYIFHPLFVPVYIALFLIEAQPYFFSGFNPAQKILVVVRFFVIYSFFPLVTVLLAKGLGFLDSIYLKTQKDRIIPYIACGIYYFFMAYVLRHQPEFSKEIVQLAIAIFIASSAGLMANIYMKVSMHAMSMGIMVIFIAMLASAEAGNFRLYFSAAILITGIVCTSRLIVSNHTPKEIYVGLLIGAASMLVGVWADGILP